MTAATDILKGLRRVGQLGFPDKPLPLQKCLEIGADNLCHPADRRIPHEVFHLDALAFAVEANRLHRRIEADFIAELEAVGKRLLRAVDTHDYAVEFMGSTPSVKASPVNR